MNLQLTGHHVAVFGGMGQTQNGRGKNPGMPRDNAVGLTWLEKHSSFHGL